MSMLAKLKLFSPSRRRVLEQDMQEELDSLASLAEAEGGRAHLGNLTRAAEEGRTVWTLVWLDQLAADARYSCRTMRKNPIFTLTAVLSLALGIGANTAIFNLIHAILLKPLAVRDPETLVVLTSHSRNEKIGNFGYQDYRALRDEQTAFAGIIAASRLRPLVAGVGNDGETVQGKVVSSNYFSVLGVRPMVGRLFEDGQEDLQIAVISEGWWRRAFGGATSAVGQDIELDGKSFEIVGIAPPGFVSETAGEATDVWTTTALMPAEMRKAAGFTWLNLMGRLKPGANVQQADASLRPRMPEMQNRFIERIDIEPGRFGGAGIRNTVSAPLTVLMAIVAVALLMACANLAGLLLARAASRKREIATRLAIGASRGRLFRQFITESVLLAMVGGFLGLGFAIWGQRMLLKLVTVAGRTISLDPRPDFAVLSFTVLVSLVTGILFGLGPAVQAVRETASEALKLGAYERVGGRNRIGLRGGLIAFQIAISMLLLVVGGFFIRTLQNLKYQDMGVRAGNVLSVGLDSRRGERLDWPNVIKELTRRVESIPGVQSASGSLWGTLANAGGVTGFRFEGYVARAGEEHRAGANWVTPQYFETVGIPLLEGRDFSPRDDANSQRVAIINETMARYYAGSNTGSNKAVGRYLVHNAHAYQIIGVARDAKYSDLRESARRFVYFAALQGSQEIRSLEIHTSGSPAGIARDVRQLVRDVEPRLRVFETTTLEQRIGQKLEREVLIASLAGFFGTLTLVLVVVGVYGMLSYSVARRTKEIGIRIALGGRLPAIAATVLQDLLIAVVIGLTFGLALALLAGRVLSSMLFGLKSTDPGTMIMAAGILGLAMAAAGCVPVHRACRVAPTRALRLE